MTLLSPQSSVLSPILRRPRALPKNPHIAVLAASGPSELDRIDYDPIARNPRPIVGFSDVTALHQAVAVKSGVATFHGPMVNLDFHDGLSPDIEAWLWTMLAGDAPLVRDLNDARVVSEGDAEGILFGGCLSLTTALTGTPFDFWIDDGIWLW